MPRLEPRRRFPIFTRGLYLHQQSDRAQTGEKEKKKKKWGKNIQSRGKSDVVEQIFVFIWNEDFLSLFRMEVIFFLIPLLEMEL